eukprot:scaffold101663_cov63-Phaeocystis_antarctica.AAC.1
MVPPPAPRGDDPGQRQLDQLRWALDAMQREVSGRSDAALPTTVEFRRPSVLYTPTRGKAVSGCKSWKDAPGRTINPSAKH